MQKLEVLEQCGKAIVAVLKQQKLLGPCHKSCNNVGLTQT